MVLRVKMTLCVNTAVLTQFTLALLFVGSPFHSELLDLCCYVIYLTDMP